MDSQTGEVNNLTVVDGNGITRTFTLITSPGYNKTIPVPVVIAFHGAGGNVNDSRAYGFQDAIASAGDQGIVILPQGINYQSFGVGWDESCDGYDMSLFDNLMKYVSDHYCVDKTRVFTTGFSWGADMNHALACCRGDSIRSIAPFSGSERNNASCTTTKWPAVRLRYGDSDPYYSVASFTSDIQFYLNKQSCSGATSSPVSPSPCVSYQACGQPVVECKFVGMQHQAPSPSEASDTWQFWKSLR